MPAVRKPEEQVIEAAHQVGVARDLRCAGSSTTRARADTPSSSVAARHGVEVAAEDDAGHRVGCESRRLEQVEDRADLAAARVLENPQRVRRAQRLEMRVDQLEAARRRPAC